MAIEDYTLLYADVFGFPTIKLKCESVDYTNPELAAGLDALFASDKVWKHPNALATVPMLTSLVALPHAPDVINLAIPGMEELITWITNTILKHAVYLNKPDATSVTITDSWANRVFRDFTFPCHIHREGTDGMAIFYHTVPLDNPSELVLIKNGTEMSLLSKYAKEDCFNIKVATGDLIIHHQSIPHAISRHNSDDPRTCLVFNFKLNSL